jgi:RNA polymerase sigma factor for flagellar operon FliA
MDKAEKAEVDKLWRLYRQTRLEGIRNALIERYRYLAKLHAEKMRHGFPAKVTLEDIYQEAMTGLITCIERYDERRAGFTTYASNRIRGAILDYLRGQDWVPRQVRTRAARIADARRRFEEAHGRAATEKELQKLLRLSARKWDEWTAETAEVHSMIMSMDRLDIVEDAAESPFACYDAELVRRLVAGLEARQKAVIELYYFQNFSMKQIGQAMDLSESRVCQIHKFAIRVLQEGAGVTVAVKEKPVRLRCGCRSPVLFQQGRTWL